MAKTSLKRPRYPMPKDVRDVLKERGLMERYQERPPYQRNDYIGWITRAVQVSTRQKRLNQMLMELKKGGVYMNMKWTGRK